MKSASLKSWSAEGRMKCSKLSLVNGCSDVGFQKNTMDQHQQMTLHPKSSQTVETSGHTGLQATWAMRFSTLPPDSRTLVSKLNTKLALM